jgi:hypothetical protein
MPKPAQLWSLTSLREKLVKISTKTDPSLATDVL